MYRDFVHVSVYSLLSFFLSFLTTFSYQSIYLITFLIDYINDADIAFYKCNALRNLINNFLLAIYSTSNTWRPNTFVYFRSLTLSASFLRHLTLSTRRCPWCSRYRRRKWTRRLEFKSWTRLITFSHSTNTLGKGMNPIILPPAMGK